MENVYSVSSCYKSSKHPPIHVAVSVFWRFPHFFSDSKREYTNNHFLPPPRANRWIETPITHATAKHMSNEASLNSSNPKNCDVGHKPGESDAHIAAAVIVCDDVMSRAVSKRGGGAASPKKV